MKFSESWLREWVNPAVSTDDLGHQFTMAGLEVDEIVPAAPPFEGVVVGEVLEVEQHPDADKLSVCRVSTGQSSVHSIVCGASNVFAGMRAPTARVGAKLPGGVKIRKTTLRGVESEGMLCSARELGLGEDAEGILSLDPSADVGADLRGHLGLDDAIIDLDLTPNRGDCFGMAGVAREISVVNRLPLAAPEIPQVPAAADDAIPIQLAAPKACPAYTGRVVRNVRSDARTPVWMQERLRRSGLRPIHPVVDVTNYVMLELGQPLHAFDLRNLKGGIVVRFAEDGETLELLDGRIVELTPDVLIIADHERAKALAGIMGGADSGVADDTTDIFFEGAFFAPLAVAGRARRFGMHTDASTRFERGVDPALQIRAVERATGLLMEIAGGVPGPVTQAIEKAHMPRRPAIGLRRSRIAALLGVLIEDHEVEDILGRLGMAIAVQPDGWRVTPPSFRFDISLEADLIEEVGRIYGYDAIPETPGRAEVIMPPNTETRVSEERARDVLVDRGYQEAITYSFIDPPLQELFAPGEEYLSLENPISSEMSAMRLSVWPGLVQAVKSNQSRQHGRIRLFEIGTKFVLVGGKLEERKTIAGAVSGERFPEQWGAESRPADLFDIKGDVEALLHLTGRFKKFEVGAGEHPALHPGQNASVRLGGKTVGWLGALRPELEKKLDLMRGVFLFELEIEPAFVANVPAYEPISKFPAVRRDVAVVVDEEVSTDSLRDTVEASAGALLRELRIFDIYRGRGIDSGRKSVALGLILQETSRTLTDQDADTVTAKVIRNLERKLNATIRD